MLTRWGNDLDEPRFAPQFMSGHRLPQMSANADLLPWEGDRLSGATGVPGVS